MKILVAAPFLSLGSCALYIFKALADLGHVPIPWDYRSMLPLNDWEYDFALVWGTDPQIIRHLRGDRPKILWYPDDPYYWSNTERNEHRILETMAKVYDRTLTLLPVKGYEWLPAGCDRQIHFSQAKEREGVVFIGTCNSNLRRQLVYELSKHLKFPIYGNNWRTDFFKDWDEQTGYDDSHMDIKDQAAYFGQFRMLVDRAKVIIVDHHITGLSTKTFEVAGVGGALMVMDDKPGNTLMFPSAPTFRSVEECVRLVKYFLDPANEAERAAKWSPTVLYPHLPV